MLGTRRICCQATGGLHEKAHDPVLNHSSLSIYSHNQEIHPLTIILIYTEPMLFPIRFSLHASQPSSLLAMQPGPPHRCLSCMHVWARRVVSRSPLTCATACNNQTYDPLLIPMLTRQDKKPIWLRRLCSWRHRRSQMWNHHSWPYSSTGRHAQEGHDFIIKK